MRESGYDAMRVDLKTLLSLLLRSSAKFAPPPLPSSSQLVLRPRPLAPLPPRSSSRGGDFEEKSEPSAYSVLGGAPRWGGRRGKDKAKREGKKANKAKESPAGDVVRAGGAAK